MVVFLGFFLDFFRSLVDSTREESREAWGWHNSGRRRPDDAASHQKIKHKTQVKHNSNKLGRRGGSINPNKSDPCVVRGRNHALVFDRTFRRSTAFVSARTRARDMVASPHTCFSLCR